MNKKLLNKVKNCNRLRYKTVANILETDTKTVCELIKNGKLKRVIKEFIRHPDGWSNKVGYDYYVDTQSVINYAFNSKGVGNLFEEE